MAAAVAARHVAAARSSSKPSAGQQISGGWLLLLVKIKMNPLNPPKTQSIQKVTLHFLSDSGPKTAAAVPCQ